MQPIEINIEGLDKDALILRLKASLGLPSYCQTNWDSLEACLYDGQLSGLTLIHVGTSALSPADRATYRQILKRWQSDAEQIQVVF